MHITTKALVLRGVDYKESDKVLTLFTQELGKITASARGCSTKAAGPPTRKLTSSERGTFSFAPRSFKTRAIDSLKYTMVSV